MQIQETILGSYRGSLGTSFTLKQISGILKIQQTRVFRLFNGWEMKVGEFQKVMQSWYGDRYPDCMKLIDSLIRHQKYISSDDLNYLNDVIETKMRLASTRGR